MATKKTLKTIISVAKMPPNSEKQETIQYEEDNVERKAGQAGPRTYKVAYKVVLVYVYWHIAGLYGVYLLPAAKWQTIVFISVAKMPPNSEKQETIQYEEDNVERKAGQAGPRTYKVAYKVVLVYVYWHIAGLYGVYLLPAAKWQTIVFTVATLWLSFLGVTAGAHRLWSHHAYKVNRPLEIFLMLCQSMSCQNSAIHWVRDHRLHHKYIDTDADPHNATRGLFYSHCGWLLVEKHPEVTKKSKTIDVSDIFNNPVLMFQKKYIKELTILTAVALPTLIPMVCWGETFNCAWHLSYLRLIININLTFLVNSANHHHGYGHRPYDKNMSAANIPYFSLIPVGETYHNYHHAYPWDYRNSELGNTFLNFTTVFIDFCAKMGWAWDRKSVSPELVRKRMARTGDGTDLWGKRIDQEMQEAQRSQETQVS